MPTNASGINSSSTGCETRSRNRAPDNPSALCAVVEPSTTGPTRDPQPYSPRSQDSQPSHVSREERGPLPEQHLVGELRSGDGAGDKLQKTAMVGVCICRCLAGLGRRVAARGNRIASGDRATASSPNRGGRSAGSIDDFGTRALGRVETGVGLSHERVNVLSTVPFGDTDREAVILGGCVDQAIDELLGIVEVAGGENRGKLVSPVGSREGMRSTRRATSFSASSAWQPVTTAANSSPP